MRCIRFCASEVSFGYGLHPGTRIAALGPCGDRLLARSDLGFAGGQVHSSVAPPIRFPVHVPAVSWFTRVPLGSNSKMQIFGPFRVSTTAPTTGAQRLQPAKAAEPTAAPKTAAPKTAAPIDKLDISNHVNRLQSTSPTTGGDIRIDRVAELRRQIASGTYDTPEKMDVALNRMLDEFA
jgi:negative regulator of flagellin synthesis FlgM